jgi:hypothetical protein
MRITTTAVAAVFLAGATLTGTAFAHHGWSSYDASKTVTIKAPVAELTWGNPHSMMWVMHEGKKVEIYLAPITRMVSRGLTQEMIPVGKEVTLEAYLSNNTGTEYRAERIMVDGKTIELR